MPTLSNSNTTRAAPRPWTHERIFEEASAFLTDCATWFRANPARKYHITTVPRAVLGWLVEARLAPTNGVRPAADTVHVVVRRPGDSVSDFYSRQRSENLRVLAVTSPTSGVSLLDNDELGGWLFASFLPIDLLGSGPTDNW